MKRLISGFFGLAVILALVMAHPAQAAPELKDTSWRVTYIGTYEVGAGQSYREPQVNFGGEGRVSGSTGCNRFTGMYQQNGESLQFTPLVMTKMSCPPPQNELEKAFIQAMAATVKVRQYGSKLEFLDALGHVQMELHKQQ
jgi:heat shock protein HslJ